MGRMMGRMSITSTGGRIMSGFERFIDMSLEKRASGRRSCPDCGRMRPDRLISGSFGSFRGARRVKVVYSGSFDSNFRAEKVKFAVVSADYVGFYDFSGFCSHFCPKMVL